MFLRSVKSFQQVALRSHRPRCYSTVAEAYEKWRVRFEDEKIAEPESSIRNLMAYALDTQVLDDVEARSSQTLSPDQLNKLQAACLARLSRMPVQYIVKDWDFRNLTLRMAPPVFIPRPETEELVGHIIDDLKNLGNDKLEILEIGSGSGAICLSLLDVFRNARCLAVDQSKMACNLTKANAELLGLADRLEVLNHKVEEGRIEALGGRKFDLIVSNPPYVPTKELREVDDDVKLYEDLRALDGGNDGLKIINHILELASNSIEESRGSLWLEVHPSHPPLIADKLEKSPQLNLKVDKSLDDFCGKPRFVKIVKK